MAMSTQTESPAAPMTRVFVVCMFVFLIALLIAAIAYAIWSVYWPFALPGILVVFLVIAMWSLIDHGRRSAGVEHFTREAFNTLTDEIRILKAGRKDDAKRIAYLESELAKYQNNKSKVIVTSFLDR